jgi:hypothetical protein
MDLYIKENYKVNRNLIDDLINKARLYLRSSVLSTSIYFFNNKAKKMTKIGINNYYTKKLQKNLPVILHIKINKQVHNLVTNYTNIICDSPLSQFEVSICSNNLIAGRIIQIV